MSLLSAMSRLWRKLGVLRRQKQFDGELDEEMAFHREQMARGLEERGCRARRRGTPRCDSSGMRRGCGRGVTR